MEIERRKNTMALSKDEILDLIEDEFGGLVEHKKLKIANDFNDANSYERFYENIDKELVDFFDNDLEHYFVTLYNSKDTYNKRDNYFRVNGNGYLTSFDDIEDELDTRALAEFIYDNWDDYEYTFDMTANEIQISEEEDEEESKEEEE